MVGKKNNKAGNKIGLQRRRKEKQLFVNGKCERRRIGKGTLYLVKERA